MHINISRATQNEYKTLSKLELTKNNVREYAADELCLRESYIRRTIIKLAQLDYLVKFIRETFKETLSRTTKNTI